MKQKKIFKTLTKPNARHYIEISTEDPDEWFLEVNKFNKKGEIKSSETIIKKDLENRLSHLKNMGWVE